jgi:hypothetical protein
LTCTCIWFVFCGLVSAGYRLSIIDYRWEFPVTSKFESGDLLNINPNFGSAFGVVVSCIWLVTVDTDTGSSPRPPSLAHLLQKKTNAVLVHVSSRFKLQNAFTLTAQAPLDKDQYRDSISPPSPSPSQFKLQSGRCFVIFTQPPPHCTPLRGGNSFQVYNLGDMKRNSSRAKFNLSRGES